MKRWKEMEQKYLIIWGVCGKGLMIRVPEEYKKKLASERR